jgi:ABC-2 type transport system permease protein
VARRLVLVRGIERVARTGRLIVFRRILHHEWRALTSDATLWALVGIFALSIGYGTWNGVRWVGFQKAAIAEAQREERERIAAHETEIQRINRERAAVSPFADPRNPEAVGRRMGGRYAIMPPTALAALTIGQSDLLPYYFKMTTDAKETVTAAAELENPQRLLTGRFDLAFVLIYLYPLLILALSYNLLSAEKEQGTLALALSQPVSLRTLALAKVTLRLLVLLTTIVLLSVAAFIIGGVDVTSPDALARIPFWFVATAAYGLFWFALAVAVSALGRGSATNAMALAATWLVLVVLLPSALNLLATSLYPVPSRVEMVQAVRAASDEANAEGSKALAKYYEDHPELAGGGADQAMNDFNIIRVAVNAEVERRVRPVLDQFDRQLASQQRLIERVRFLSPAIVMQDALNDISGTGISRHRHFMTQVSEYHQRWRNYFVPLVFRKAQLESFAEIPRFSFVEEELAAAAGRVTVSLGAMLLPTLLVAAVGVHCLRRYPIAD